MTAPPVKKNPPGYRDGNPGSLDIKSATKTYTKADRTSKGNLTPQAKWARENPKARWAHVALASALRRGLIERKHYEVCGAEPADAHHENYDMPMAVTWLCRRHHKQVHKKRGDVR